MRVAATTYSPIQYSLATGSPRKSVPTISWCMNASAIARYAYRWMPYHVSYESRRRAIATDVTPIATSSAMPAVAIRT